MGEKREKKEKKVSGRISLSRKNHPDTFFVPRWKTLIVIATLAAELLGPLAAAQDGDAVAIVNGKPIPRKEVRDLVMEAHGLSAMQQLIVLELARQECRRRGLRVTQAEIDAEFRDSLNRIAPEKGADGVTLAPDQRQQALEIVLEQKAVSMAEFRVGMKRNAYLRKIVENDLRVDEALLREEFNRTYGMKVRIRHIQIDATKLNEVTSLLRSGEDFARVAERMSQNRESAPLGGERPPFTFDDESLPVAMRDVAFSLKPSEVSSAVRVGKWYHIIRLEQRIEPRDVRFADVRDEVERKMRARVVPQEMQRFANELFQKADIRVLDRKLKRQYQKLLERNAAAATRTDP